MGIRQGLKPRIINSKLRLKNIYFSMDTWDAERQEFKDDELEEERVEGLMGRVGVGLICA